MLWCWLIACGSSPADKAGGPLDTANSAVRAGRVVGVSTTPNDATPGHRVRVSLDARGWAVVACRATDDAADVLVIDGPAADGAATLRLLGLRPDVPYRCAATNTDGRGVVPFDLTGPSPGGQLLPGTTTTTHPTLAPTARWLLTVWDGAGGCDLRQTLLVLDHAGRVRWWYQQDELASVDVEALYHPEDGTIVWGGNTQDGVHVVHLWLGVEWSGIRSAEPLYHHDAKRLDDGSVLVLEHRTDTNGAAEWIGYAVVIRDVETDAVLWEWASQVGFDAGVLPAGAPGADTYHANWADRLPLSIGERVLLSQCFDSKILAIDPGTGEVDFWLGAGGPIRLVDADGQPLPDSDWPQCQHGVDLSGPDTLLLYDNGRQRRESRIVELALDLEAGTATPTWTWTDGWHERTLGDVDPLGPGRALITQAHPECWSPTGERSRVLEVDRATGEVVWELEFDSERAGIYRSEKIDGCAFPSIHTCDAAAARWQALEPVLGLD
ncbi:MAG: hypothetical protein ACI8PZ_001039 [Myxococcota bacterium]|jgi:hypothetical protein